VPAIFKGALFDLLMAVMDSPTVWSTAAGDRERGLVWRDAVTARMTARAAYVPYVDLVVAEAKRLGLPPETPDTLVRSWGDMQPWPDAAALAGLEIPFGFVTNCSASLALIAASRPGLRPRFVLSAEEIGWYKPHPAAYRAGCERLGVAPAETLFVAGAPYDALGAHAAGLQVRLVMRRPDQAGVASELPVSASLEEIAKAVARA
jgi:2-haloacid dehalogenase